MKNKTASIFALIVFFVLHSIQVFGQTDFEEITNEESESHIHIPSSNFKIVPPEGFDDGDISLVHDNGMVQIIEEILPQPFEGLKKGFDPANEGVKSGNNTIVKVEKLKINNREARLVRMEIGLGGRKYEKQLILFKNENQANSSVAVSCGYFQEMADQFRTAIYTSLKTVIYEPSLLSKLENSCPIHCDADGSILGMSFSSIQVEEDGSSYFAFVKKTGNPQMPVNPNLVVIINNMEIETDDSFDLEAYSKNAVDYPGEIIDTQSKETADWKEVRIMEQQFLTDGSERLLSRMFIHRNKEVYQVMVMAPKEIDRDAVKRYFDSAAWRSN